MQKRRLFLQKCRFLVKKGENKRQVSFYGDLPFFYPPYQKDNTGILLNCFELSYCGQGQTAPFRETV